MARNKDPDKQIVPIAKIRAIEKILKSPNTDDKAVALALLTTIQVKKHGWRYGCIQYMLNLTFDNDVHEDDKKLLRSLRHNYNARDHWNGHTYNRYHHAF